MRKAAFNFFILIIIQNLLMAQPADILREEIDAKKYDFIYFVPVRTEGLICIQHITKVGVTTDDWELRHYNVNMRLVKKEEFSCGGGYRLLQYFDDGDSVFYAFLGDKSGSNRFEVVKFNYKTGYFSKTKTINDQRISSDFFDVLAGNQFIAGVRSPSVGNNLGQLFYTLTLVPIFTGSKVYSIPPTLLVRSQSNNSLKQIVFDLKGESEIVSTRVNHQAKVYGMVIRNTHKRQTTIHYYEFDTEGTQIYHTVLKEIAEKNLLTGKLVPLSDATFSFIGTYNDDTRKRKSNDATSTGIFVSKLNHGRETLVKFHSFSEFTNAKKALDYRYRKKYEEYRNKGQELEIGFKLLVHDQILQFDSTFVILMESYYPEYHYEIYNNFYGPMYSDQIFDGYRFTNAFAAAFDKSGDLVWDNLFAISDMISYSLQENVIVYFDGNTQVLLYYNHGKIFSKVISGNEIVFQKDETEVPTVGSSERVLSENYNRINHWYGPYFLLTGYQEVADEHGKKRKVFFFLKLKFG